MFIKKIKKYILYRLHILFSDVYLFIAHFHALCNTVSIISPVCRHRSSKRFDIPKTHFRWWFIRRLRRRPVSSVIHHTYLHIIWLAARYGANPTIHHCGCFFSITASFISDEQKRFFFVGYNIVVCNILLSLLALKIIL